MTKEERKQLILEDIVWETLDVGSKGGQSVSVSRPMQVLIHEDLGIKISINHYRSTVKNKELCLLLFDKALDNIIKE